MFQRVVFLLEKMNRGGSKKSLIWKRTAVTGAILAAMAAPLIVMPTRADADLASAVDSGSYGPVVTIVSPQYADVVKGNSVSIDVAVQQRSNPAKALQMFVDDHIATPGWVPLKSLQSSKFNWDTTLFSNGPHKLTVRVADSAGLIGQAEITVYVNNAAQSQQQTASAPALQWLGVQNGQVLKGVVNLQLQASANFGVKYIFVMLNSVSDPDKKPALRSWMINQPPYIIPFDTTKVNDGAYVLDALAYDALSNQGEAPRLNIGIANNTINPTYFNSPSTPADNSTPSTEKANTPTNTDSPEKANSTPNTPSNPPAPNTGHSSNTTVASTQTAPLVLPFQPVAPTLIPQQSRNGALHDNIAGSDNDNGDNGNSLMVETVASAQLQRPTPEAQPRVTPLPMRLASNDVPTPAATPVAVPDVPPTATLAQPTLFASANDGSTSTVPSLNNNEPLTTMASSLLSELPTTIKDVPTSAATPVAVPNVPPTATLAQPMLFASTNDTPATLSLSNDQPLTTMASSQLSTLPMATRNIKPHTTEMAAPVREAKLPSLPVPSNNSMAESMRQSSPLSTIVNTQTPNSMVTQAKLAQSAPQRYFQVNDALSIPLNNVAVAPVEKVTPALPVFPPASLNPRTAKIEVAPTKSTFTAPAVGMTDANVTSRMAQATPGSHTSPRLMANAQIGTLPGYVAPKPASAPHHVVYGQPLFTSPNTPTLANSRIASANISGKSWGYQRNTENASGQSTKPQIAFLPKFNSKPKTDSFASITVSPVSPKMQVSEMSQSWPAIYQAKQNERLSAIAERYGLPVEVLAKNNSLQDGAILTAGQKIKMPRNLQVTYNGKALHSDVSSMLVGTTSVAAFRFLFERQGGKVTWDSTTQTVHAKNGDDEITLTIGSDKAMVNQKAVMMDMAAFLLSGRTMVPVRLFEKSLNADVTWDPSTGRMFVAMAG